MYQLAILYPKGLDYRKRSAGCVQEAKNDPVPAVHSLLDLDVSVDRMQITDLGSDKKCS